MEQKNPWSLHSPSKDNDHHQQHGPHSQHFDNSSNTRPFTTDEHDIQYAQKTVLFPGKPSLHSNENDCSPHHPSIAWPSVVDAHVSEEKGDEGGGSVSARDVEADRHFPLEECLQQRQEVEGWRSPTLGASLDFSPVREQKQQELQHERPQKQQRSPSSLADSAVAFVDADRASNQSTAVLVDHGYDLFRSDSLDSDAAFGSDIWRASSSSLPAEAADKDDVLELLVQKLQSEIADTRATVLDLENRLSAAENTNKHIVEELKMLLADAEGTLIGSDDSDGGENGTPGNASKVVEEDANVVYNRICGALQNLITDAQAALARTSTTTSNNALPLNSSTTSLVCSASGRCSCPPYQHRLYSTSGNLLLNSSSVRSTSPSISTRTDPHDYISDKDHHYHHHHHHSHNTLHPPSSRGSRLTSRRSSLSPQHISFARGSSQPLYPPAPVCSYHTAVALQQSEEFSRIRWKEKQQEQYERYRRSCDRVTLELELLLRDTSRTLYGDEADVQQSQQQQQQQHRRRKQHSNRHHSQTQQQQQQQQQLLLLSSTPLSISTPPSSGASTAVPSQAGSPTVANVPAQCYEGGSDKHVHEQQQQQQGLSGKARAMKARLEKIQRLQRQYLSLSQAANDVVGESSSKSARQSTHSNRQSIASTISHSSISSSGSNSSGTTIAVTSPTSTRNVGTMPDMPPMLHPNKSLVMQLYGLWRQTTLRTQFMHVLTTLVEALLAGWIVVKLAQWTLTLLGVQYQRGWADLQRYLYGHREGTAGASAKELYQRIRRDSARRRRLLEWRDSLSSRLGRWLTFPSPRPLSSNGDAASAMAAETLVTSISQAAAAAVQDEETQRRAMKAMAVAYPSTRMLTDPVRRVAGHIVSGLLLALVVDQAKRLSRRL
ncbi:hypothetical protein BGW41_007383 [Actinomortierella wolfii]|nr:hypothetical protein BGW41_007383 [Actinomortierella wolfii]